jgi:hypothetical protein
MQDRSEREFTQDDPRGTGRTHGTLVWNNDEGRARNDKVGRTGNGKALVI